MEFFKELYPAAELLDCVSYVKQMEELADVLESREKTEIVVTGSRGSGKTTAINKMVGFQVWEPGNMDELEKPLRVCFEPMEENETYQCMMAVSREWSAQDAVIFELREEDLVHDGQLTTHAVAADTILFLISARAPFNMDEINLLKRMNLLDRQVIVNGIETVKETDREKIENYIEKINQSLGLPTVIYMEERDGDFGKTVRNVLPAYLQQKESRSRRIRYIKQTTVSILKKILEDKLAENKEAEGLHASQEENNSRIRRIKADCYTLRMDVEDCKKKAKAKVKDSLIGAETEMVSAVMKNVSVRDMSLEDIQKEAEEVYLKKAEEVFEAFRETFEKDCNNIRRNAQILGIPEPEINFWDYFQTYLDASTVYVGKTQGTSGKSHRTRNILIGTGLFAGGFVLAPLPTLVSLAGAAGSVVIGKSMYSAEKEREKAEDVQAALRESFSIGLDNIQDKLNEYAGLAYGALTEALQNYENQMTEQPITTSSCDGLVEKLQQAKQILDHIEI